MKKLITLALALCILIPAAQATVVYNDYTPDKTMSFGSTLSFDLDGDLNDDITFSTSGSGASDYVITVTGTDLEFAAQAGGIYTESLFIGKVVDAGKNWAASTARIASAGAKNIAGGKEFFIGVRVKGSNNNYFYGWILMELKSNLELVVKSTAFETSQNRIVVGNTGSALLSQDEQEVSELSFYPTQVSDVAKIESNVELSKVIVYNQAGTKVLEAAIEGKEFTLEVAHLPKGIYLIKVETQKAEVLEDKFLKL